MCKKVEEIKKFWDDKAIEYGEDGRATLGESYLRLLEIRTMIRQIKCHKPRNVLDVGCGNGYSTKIFAKRFPSIQFVGMDYSEHMILCANKNQIKNCTFLVGDVLDLNSFPEEKFDLILTQRCLQNLVDYKSQYEAIKNLIGQKAQRGMLLLMECSKDGVERLNKIRIRFGKKPIENIEPWHNTFFIEKNLINDFKAKIIHFSSTYMFLSKIIDPRLSFLGYILPTVGKFGYDKLYKIR